MTASKTNFLQHQLGCLRPECPDSTNNRSSNNVTKSSNDHHLDDDFPGMNSRACFFHSTTDNNNSNNNNNNDHNHLSDDFAQHELHSFLLLQHPGHLVLVGGGEGVVDHEVPQLLEGSWLHQVHLHLPDAALLPERRVRVWLATQSFIQLHSRANNDIKLKTKTKPTRKHWNLKNKEEQQL